MTRKQLVILKSGVTEFKHHDTYFKPRTFYRCLSEASESSYLVYGEWFNQKQFDNRFELAYDFLLRTFEELGVIVNGKPISKTAFGQILDIHQYGRTSQSGLKIAYLRNRRDNIIGFYPAFKGETKKQTIEGAYTMFIETFIGNMDFVDCQRVQIGNSGIPISYGDLRNK